jgi:NAD-dependent SIR2 family protein deacetylase
VGDSPSDAPLSVDDLVLRIKSAGQALHWLAGAGVSSSAGVPTAWDLIYDFKRTLYALAKRHPITDLDAADPDVRLRLDAHFLGRDGFPAPGDPEEYAAFFEAVHQDAASRQRKIEEVLRDASPKPNLGHLVLASMWQLGLLHAVWTTNFDDVLEQAAAEVSGAPRWLTVADLAEPSKAERAFTDTSLPLLVKMHGDFQSQRLDNTKTELTADNQLRRTLTEAVRTRGLVVVGYSGRDASVMDALAAALDADRPFSAGLYWVVRPGSRLLPRVSELLESARSHGAEARLVECASFEELMQAVRVLLPVDAKLEGLFNRFQPAKRISEFASPSTGGRWPKLRLNAVAVAEHPRSARLVKCTIGGSAEVRAAILAAGVDAVAARRKDGVIAFGRDEDLLTAFREHQPTLDYSRLDPAFNADIGLMYDALVAALGRSRPLLRRGRRLLIVDPDQVGSSALEPLRRAGLGDLAGRIPGTSGAWAEGIELRLELRHETLWLIYAPTVWPERTDDADEYHRRREWTRERQVKRYNRPYTALLKAWADVITNSAPEARLQALGLGRGGTDAEFTIKRLAPFVERHAS